MSKAASPNPTMIDRLRRLGPMFVLMYVASLALSLVSGLETFDGLRKFSSAGMIGTIVAFGLTFGVQTLLFVVSWMIAENLREGWRVLAPLSAIWLISAAFSGYFSYYGFFYLQGGPNEEDRLDSVRSRIEAVYTAVDEAFQDKQRKDHEALVKEGGALQIWQETALRPMIVLATGARDQLRTAQALRLGEISDERRGLETRKVALDSERTELSRQLGNLVREQESAQAETIRLDTEIKAATQRLATAQTEVDALTVQRNAEEKNGGCRSRCKAVELDLGTAQSKVDNERTRISGLTQQLAAANEALDRAAAQLEAGTLNDRVISLDGELSKIGAELEALASEATKLETAEDLDFDAAEGLLSQAMTAVQNRDYSGIEVARQQCDAIKARLVAARIADAASRDCQSTEVDALASSLMATVADQKAFAETCRAPTVFDRPLPGGAPGAPARMSVSPAISAAQTCLQYTPDADLRTDLLDDMQNLLRTRGDGASPSTAAVSSLTNGETNAVLAAFFALIVDLLVLLCALIGRNVGKPENVRAIDQVLRMLHVDRRDGYEYMLRLPTDPRKAALIDDTVTMLMRQGLAVWDDETRTALRLHKEATAVLRDLRASHSGEPERSLRPDSDTTRAAPPPHRVRPL